MSYREESGGQVVLTLSRDDYDKLLRMQMFAMPHFQKHEGFGERILAFMNRVHEGNPNYRPYEIQPSDAVKAEIRQRKES